LHVAPIHLIHIALFFSFLLAIRFGKPITMEDYAADFLSTDEGAAKLAVKRLTSAIERQMIEITINAPDWWVFLFLYFCLPTLT